MTEKKITLKFEDGRTETVTVFSDNPKHFSAQIEEIMHRKGAYGFSTESTVNYR